MLQFPAFIDVFINESLPQTIYANLIFLMALCGIVISSEQTVFSSRSACEIINREVIRFSLNDSHSLSNASWKVKGFYLVDLVVRNLKQ